MKLIAKVGIILLLTSAAAAYAQESVIFSFTLEYNQPDGKGPAFYNPYGATPTGTLLLDAQGNLYGTNSAGRASTVSGGGAVYELSPVPPYYWKPKLLHAFAFPTTGTDGYFVNPGVISDAQGNLYGTTYEGGAFGGGTVFELSPGTGGIWTEKVLFSFTTGGVGGWTPNAAVTLDRQGNLYGTTNTGGTNSGGAVFELSPGTAGWTVKELASFSAPSANFGTTQSGVVFDTHGNLYGAQQYGGANNGGFVYELTPAESGSWTETVLHNFADPDTYGPDGALPVGTLTLDGKGNVYGTTANGGSFSGVVYELSPGTTGGEWKESILHNFYTTGFTDGFAPDGGVVFDAAGNLFGTTSAGGLNGSEFGLGGTLYKLTPTAGGSWKETVLYAFPAVPTDGAQPEGSLVFDAQGNLYGTAYTGGGPDANIEGTPVGEGAIFRYEAGATTVALPEISPAGGSYDSPQMVTVTDATPGAKIYYTTNGCEPNASANLYDGPIKVSSSQQVKAIAYNSVHAQSGTATAIFTIP